MLKVSNHLSDLMDKKKIPSIKHNLNLNPNRCETAWNMTILGIPPATRRAEQFAAPWDEATDTHNSWSGNAKHDQTQRRKLPGWSCLLPLRESGSSAVPSLALPAAAAENRLQDPRGIHYGQAGHWEAKGRAQHLLLLPSVTSLSNSQDHESWQPQEQKLLQMLRTLRAWLRAVSPSYRKRSPHLTHPLQPHIKSGDHKCFSAQFSERKQ